MSPRLSGRTSSRAPRSTASSASSSGSRRRHWTSISATAASCLGERVGADGGDRGALVVALRREQLGVAGADGAANAGGRERGREVDLLDLGARVRAAEDRGLEHPGETDVAGVERLAARARVAVEACSGPADDVARALRPLIERVLVDDEPDLLELALDLLLRADQSCHVRIASSIFG